MVWTGGLLLASCAADKKPVVLVEGVQEPYLDFDLVPRAHDDNGLPLNPELGWSYYQRCEEKKPVVTPDPLRCSWRFRRGPRHPNDARILCNNVPVDPDFSTVGLTDLGITCSDSPLSYPGHLNWDTEYGGAVTYEGWLNWEEYSEPPGDSDLNFVLQMHHRNAPVGTLGGSVAYVGVELDSTEIPFCEGWWSGLNAKVHGEPLEVADYVGTARAIVTGLLGVDAEHMSKRDMKLELHPAYAIALQASSDSNPVNGTDRWALLARAVGNEGTCSHWRERPHQMRLLKSRHTFRLPWKKGMSHVCVDDHTTFYGVGKGSVDITISNEKDQGVLVTVQMPQTTVVEGDLYLVWTGVSIESETPKPEPRFRTRQRELRDPAKAAQRVAILRNSKQSMATLSALIEEAGTAGCLSVPWHGSRCKSLSAEKMDPVPPRSINDCKPPPSLVSDERSRPPVTAEIVGPRPVVTEPVTEPPPYRPSAVELFCKKGRTTPEAEKFCSLVGAKR